MQYSPQEIRGGISQAEALNRFRSAVNRPDTMFSTDRWLLPNLVVLAQLLHDPITQDEANALLDVLYERRRMSDLLEWLKEMPTTWANFFTYREFKRKEAERVELERYKVLDERWARRKRNRTLTRAEQEAIARSAAEAKSYYLHRAHPCPRCGTPPEHLEWYAYCSPPSSWKRLMGRAGWRTRCKFCLQEIDFFCGVMS